MKNWTTRGGYTVKETNFDYDLHCFEVYNGDEHLGGIYPATIDGMNTVIADLDNGACPIMDSWEDGNGNTCYAEGWGQ